MLNQLITKAQTYNLKLKTDLIHQAYHFADAALVGEKRLSGETLLQHSVAVANHLADIKVDSYTLAAALLHDVIEKSDATKTDLVKEFGETVAELVDGVSVIKKMKTATGQNYQVENLRKLFLATAKDVRVVLIRLAEKLHSLQTLEGLPKELRGQTIQKAFDIYAPLADRVGVYHFKWQIEDLAFQHADPTNYQRIDQYYKERREQREAHMQAIIQNLTNLLNQHQISADVFGRVKHHYSVYKKYLVDRYGDESIEDYMDHLHDKLAFMILVNSVDECYATLGLIHQHWNHHPGKFDDYIANPKPNGYRSIQTAIFTNRGELIEIQIKTYKMHEYNEFGPASHLFYKEMGRQKGSHIKAPEKRIAWLKDLVEWQEEILEDKEFEEALKIDVFGDRVFVFTPKGEVKDLPDGSTPIDFAYTVHTDIGHNTTGAKVDGKLVPLNYRLKNGQVVEILTSKKKKLPNQDWLEFVRTRTAKHQIRKALKQKDLK